MDDLIHFLSGNENISALIFENSSKAANCDRFVAVIAQLPSSVDSLHFNGSLSPKGIHSLASIITDHKSITSLTLQNIALKNDVIPFIQGLNESCVENLVRFFISTFFSFSFIHTL